MTDAAKPKDPNVERLKEVKGLLESYLKVAQHKLGRAPSMEELTKMMDEGDTPPGHASTTPVASQTPEPSPAQAPAGTSQRMGVPAQKVPNQPGQPVAGQPRTRPEKLDKDGTASPATMLATAKGAGPAADIDAPAILRYIVYYGRGEKGEPDPRHILFYHDPEMKRWYDCDAKRWSEGDAPGWIQHLPSRPISGSSSDLLSAIASGIMTGDEFNHLGALNILTADAKRLGALVGLDRAASEPMEKSEDKPWEKASADEKQAPKGEGKPQKPQAMAGKGSNDAQKPGPDATKAEKNDYGSEAFADDTTANEQESATKEVAGSDQMREIMRGVNRDKLPSIKDPGHLGDGADMGGEDVLAQIIEAAFAEAQQRVAGDMRSMIRAEIRSVFAELGFEMPADTDDGAEVEKNDNGPQAYAGDNSADGFGVK